LYAAIGPEPPGRFDYFNAYAPLFRPIYEDIKARTREQAEAMRAVFGDVVKRWLLSAEWRMASGYSAHRVALHGRYADLLILGQIDPAGPWSPLLHPAPDEVAMTAGRPILVVPYVGDLAQIALYLARHGVRANVERSVCAGVDVGNVLLSRASDLDADLLVMGPTVIPGCANSCSAAPPAPCCPARRYRY
jgi:hypothetical protein